MRRIDYFDTGTPQKREPGVDSSWPKLEKDESLYPDIRHREGLAQVEGTSLGVTTQIEPRSSTSGGIEILPIDDPVGGVACVPFVQREASDDDTR